MKDMSSIVGPHAYSDRICDKKIVILGINPPPLGGISIHVQRVACKFRQQGNTVEIFDIEKRARGLWGFCIQQLRIITFLIKHKPDLVYHHTLTCFFSGRLFELALVIVLKWFLGYRVIMVDHVSRFFARQSRAYKKMAHVLFRALDAQVLIGSSTYASYRENGIFLGKRWSVEAAFLPPDRAGEQEILSSYPADLHEFLRVHTPVIVANASKMALFHVAGQLNAHAGKDLYGFDLCLESLEQLELEYPKIGLILALSSMGDATCFAKLIKTIEKKESVYLMYQCAGELWPLLKRVNLFVRPTLSDSFGISVAEAIHVGTPAIASDVCIRPAGTVLFKAGDTEDFLKKVREVLQKHEAINERRDYSHTQQTF